MNFYNIDKYIYDVEIYPNYFCVVLKLLEKDRIYVIDTYNFLERREELYKIIENSMLISYGGHSFDDRVLELLYKLKKKKKIFFPELHKKIQKLNKSRNENFEDTQISSFDISIEFKTNVGVKGFTFNLGEKIIEHNKDFNRPLWKNQTKNTIEYCISDVLKTEKLYKKFIVDNEDIFYEKELLFKAIYRKRFDFFEPKERAFILRYTREELAQLLLKRDKKVKAIPKNNKNQIDKFMKIPNFYNNKKKNTVYLIKMNEDYLFKILLYLEKNNKFIVKNLDLAKFDIFTEKYKKNLYYFLIDSKSFIYEQNQAKYIIKLRNILLKKILKFVKKLNGRFLKVIENNIFIDGISETKIKKLNLLFQEYFENIIDIKIEKVEKFIRLNKQNQDFFAITESEEMSSGIFESGYFVNPSKSRWIPEVLKLYFLEKFKIEDAVKKIYLESPTKFFMYYSTVSKANECDGKGKILNKIFLELEKKYRVYYSKTGNFKPVDRRKHLKELKYISKYGFGDINANYFKMKIVDVDVKDFVDFNDFDLRSYIHFAKNFVKEDKNLINLT